MNIKRGIFQSDRLSPMLFVMCKVPLPKGLRTVKAGLVIKEGKVKVKHLLVMDALKIFGRSEREINSLATTVLVINRDVEGEFLVKECGVVM